MLVLTRKTFIFTDQNYVYNVFLIEDNIKMDLQEVG